MKCHRYGSTEHLARECHLPPTGGKGNSGPVLWAATGESSHTHLASNIPSSVGSPIAPAVGSMPTETPPWGDGDLAQGASAREPATGQVTNHLVLPHASVVGYTLSPSFMIGSASYPAHDPLFVQDPWAAAAGQRARSHEGDGYGRVRRRPNSSPPSPIQPRWVHDGTRWQAAPASGPHDWYTTEAPQRSPSPTPAGSPQSYGPGSQPVLPQVPPFPKAAEAQSPASSHHSEHNSRAAIEAGTDARRSCPSAVHGHLPASSRVSSDSNRRHFTHGISAERAFRQPNIVFTRKKGTRREVPPTLAERRQKDTPARVGIQ